jgi:hypothetical protein
MEKKDFKRLFPNLADEMESGASKVDLKKAIEPQPSTEPSYKEDRRFAGYQPGVIDFIRRCKKPQEAEEIIAYLEKRGDVSGDEAKTLRKQLKEGGLRSFGLPKKIGDYERST